MLRGQHQSSIVVVGPGSPSSIGDSLMLLGRQPTLSPVAAGSPTLTQATHPTSVRPRNRLPSLGLCGFEEPEPEIGTIRDPHTRRARTNHPGASEIGSDGDGGQACGHVFSAGSQFGSRSAAGDVLPRRFRCSGLAALRSGSACRWKKLGFCRHRLRLRAEMIPQLAGSWRFPSSLRVITGFVSACLELPVTAKRWLAERNTMCI